MKSVCPEHVPDYARDGRTLTASHKPCVVCGEPSVIILPDITCSYCAVKANQSMERSP